jgi:hypothetical protein
VSVAQPLSALPVTSEADKHRWTAALVAFDFCDPSLLATMIENQPIPIEIRSVIATIVAGVRKPNKRSAAKSKLPPAERYQIGATVGGLLDVIADMKHPAITENYADKNAVEPKDAIIMLNKYIDKTYSLVEAKFVISRETVENVVREWRKKRKDWPNV